MEKTHSEKEIINDVSHKSIIKLICLVVVFLLLIDGVIYFYLQKDNPNLAYKIITKKWKMLENMTESKNWLILGDSTCNQGVSASIFEEEFNASAINLCAIGALLTVNDSWMLETYISKFGPPKNVLIVHTYDIWQRDTVEPSLASQLPIAVLMKEKPKPWVFSKEEELSLLLYKYWPLFYQKQSLSGAVYLLTKNGSTASHESFDEKGFMSMKDANPDEVMAEAERKKNILENQTFHMSENNSAGLENIKKLAERYDFDIFIANGPIYNHLSEDDNFKSYFSDIKKYLENYADTSKKVHYMDEIYAFPENEMVSSDHVIEKAAREYSKELSENIKKITKH